LILVLDWTDAGQSGNPAYSFLKRCMFFRIFLAVNGGRGGQKMSECRNADKKSSLTSLVYN
jgi:hypothetical protein